MEKKQKRSLEESVIEQITDVTMRESALDFAAWMRENKLTPSHYGINRWKASNKGSGICFIVLGSNIWKRHDSWVIRLDLTHISEYQESIYSAGLREFVWANMHHCWHCAGCSPGIDMTILGKDFSGLCKTKILYCGDAGADEIAAIEKLIEFEKKARAESGKKQ